MHAAPRTVAQSAEKPVGSTRDERFFKSGTIERFTTWRGHDDGRQLHPYAKLLGVILLGYARKDFRCRVTETDLCADSGIADPKTVRKHITALIDDGLITVSRANAGGFKQFDVSGIYKRFGEKRSEPSSKVTQIGKLSRSESATKSSVDRETLPDHEETFPVRPGNFPGLDEETFRVSITSSSSSISPNLGRLAKKMGVPAIDGDRRKDLQIVDLALSQWRDPDGTSLGERKIRELVKRHGFEAILNAVMFVRDGEKRHRENVTAPLSLFRYALANRLIGGSDEEEQTGKNSRSTDPVDAAAKAFLKTRCPVGFYLAFVTKANFASVDGKMLVTCETNFEADMIRRPTHRAALLAAAQNLTGFDAFEVVTE